MAGGLLWTDARKHDLEPSSPFADTKDEQMLSPKGAGIGFWRINTLFRHRQRHKVEGIGSVNPQRALHCYVLPSQEGPNNNGMLWFILNYTSVAAHNFFWLGDPLENNDTVNKAQSSHSVS